jgi:hypothetical protein
LHSAIRARSSLPDDDPDWSGGVFNVEVEVGSFLKWLDREIAGERERQSRWRRSRRLFDYPFWSIETTLCWIADEELESEPESKLLNALTDGRLKAREEDRVVPQSYWATRASMAEGLGHAPWLLRVAREDILRAFPEETRSHEEVRACRQIKVDRIVERMRRTRKWINCGEIAEWCTAGAVKPLDRKTRRASTLDRLSGRSELRLLSSDSSVVRLSVAPEPQSVDLFAEKSVSVPNYLEDCWLPNEMCRNFNSRNSIGQSTSKELPRLQKNIIHQPSHLNLKPNLNEEGPGKSITIAKNLNASLLMDL